MVNIDDLENERCLGYNIFSGTIDRIDLEGERCVVNTINAYSYVVAKKDQLFRNALQCSTVLVPDGFPIVHAVKILNRKKIKKIAGEEVFYSLMDRCNKEHKRVFFLGASETTLRQISDRAQIDFPNVAIGTFSPPFKIEFSDLDTQAMINNINLFKPHVLFVGMTAPKQEKWVSQNSKYIDANVICSVGAVFDFFSGRIKRPDRIWIMLRMEWFIRLIKEPGRLWQRYLIYSPQIYLDILRVFIHSHKQTVKS
jgi:N-acetylglucosaminyldiphosphoundecaprenol N-acetyl-beta-D-mannosaminyltransferase